MITNVTGNKHLEVSKVFIRDSGGKEFPLEKSDGSSKSNKEDSTLEISSDKAKEEKKKFVNN